MRTSNVPIVLSSLVLAVAGCVAAPADDAREDGQASSEAVDSTQASMSEAQQVGDKDSQARMAEATSKLERAFSDQFVRGAIDREALADRIHDAVASFPEDARREVQEHIDAVIDQGEQAASQMTPEQRADMAQPPENLDRSQLDLIARWGWARPRGWRGMGAFGFPRWGRAGWGRWGWGRARRRW
jgi:hypothetical protein